MIWTYFQSGVSYITCFKSKKSYISLYTGFSAFGPFHFIVPPSFINNARELKKNKSVDLRNELVLF